MPVFGKRVDGPGGRRRAVREQVLLGAAAITLEKSQSVLVEEVCPNGAKLRGQDLPPAGAQMMVKSGAIEMLATVAWARRGSCGISFDVPLDENGVRLLKQEGRWANLFGIEPSVARDPLRKRPGSYQLEY